MIEASDELIDFLFGFLVQIILGNFIGILSLKSLSNLDLATILNEINFISIISDNYKLKVL